jgi:glycosyltransferase involved in cell wall biosynthesis
VSGSDGPPLRIAYFSNFSPKKLGTGEDRLVRFARRAAERGHALTYFGRRPIHPEVERALSEEKAAWRPLNDVEAAPIRASRGLARHFDVIQLNMIPPRSRASLAAYLAAPARVLFVDRVSGPPDEASEAPAPLIRRLADRVTMLRVHELAGITDYVRSRAQRRFGLTPDRTRTIYNGVCLERFRPMEPRREERGPLRILSVASLIREKGLDVLVRAVAAMRHTERTLRIVGEGPERSALEGLVQDLALRDRVAFLGLRDDVPHLMRESDLFVHPAIWQEALGNTILEAMASGLCTLASKVGGIPELMRDGLEGRLLPAGDVQELAAALDTVAADGTLRELYGTAARRRVERDFGLETSIACHLDWCEQAARGRKAVSSSA